MHNFGNDSLYLNQLFYNKKKHLYWQLRKLYQTHYKHEVQITEFSMENVSTRHNRGKRKGVHFASSLTLFSPKTGEINFRKITRLILHSGF